MERAWNLYYLHEYVHDNINVDALEDFREEMMNLILVKFRGATG